MKYTGLVAFFLNLHSKSTGDLHHSTLENANGMIVIRVCIYPSRESSFSGEVTLLTLINLYFVLNILLKVVIFVLVGSRPTLHTKSMDACANGESGQVLIIRRGCDSG